MSHLSHGSAEESEGRQAEGPSPKRVKLASLQDEPLTSTIQSSKQEDRSIHHVIGTNDNLSNRERDVGIVSYVNEIQAAFCGILKKRYTDFQVNEITPDGHVLHFSGSRLPQIDNNEHEESEEGLANASMSGNSTFGSLESQQTLSSDPQLTSGTPNEVSAEDRATLAEFFTPEVLSQILALDISILANPKAKPSEHPTVRSPLTMDRSLRGTIHGHIRRIFSSRIESQTDQSGVLVLSAAKPSSPANNRKPGRGKMSWIDRGGEHLHFSLYKENKDSMEMVSLLARLLKCNPKDLRIAGTKDRRAVTVQRISGYRQDARRLVGVNKTLRAAAVGDFEYKPHGLELGELSGNEFTIALRDVTIANPAADLKSLKKDLTSKLASLHTHGFLNYFGMQRFGTFKIRTDEIGARILNNDFEGACNMLLSYNPDILSVSDPDIDSTIGRDDYSRAEAISIWNKTHRINPALDKMPRRFNAETTIIKYLSKRPSDFLGALLAIPRAQRTLYVHAYQSRVWNKAATHRWQTYGSNIVEGDLVIFNEHKDKDPQVNIAETVDADGEVILHPSTTDSARSSDDIFERARPLSASEASSGKYTIFDIVLPTPGWDVELPQNKSGEFYKTYMASDEGGNLDPHDMRRKQRDFSLSGSYRKLMARIGEGWEVDVRRYKDEDQTLLETDLERVQNNHQERETTSNGAEDASGDGDRLAVILKFRLGTSQYATMALRELSRGGITEYKPEFSGGR